jgi:hypothetical protein
MCRAAASPEHGKIKEAKDCATDPGQWPAAAMGADLRPNSTGLRRFLTQIKASPRGTTRIKRLSEAAARTFMRQSRRTTCSETF